MSIQTIALRAAQEHGWAVFPITIHHDESKCDGGRASCKRLHFPSRWSQVSSSDPALVRKQDWSEANAYGIDCGKSGLLVVDQDPGATWPFNGTRTHTTGRGVHHLYADLLGIRASRTAVAPWGVDIRADGAMVVGPGSYHPHGEYAVGHDLPLSANIPGELLQALQRPRGATAHPRVEPGALDPLQALERMEGCYRRMAEARPGERNTTLNAMAGAAAGIWSRVPEDARTGELDPGTIRQRMLAAVFEDDDPAASEATFSSGWSWGLDNPVPDSDLSTTGFFDSTPTLDHIRRAAHSRGLKAPLVLANVLARVLMEVPTGWVLPPVVGAEAPLNLGIAVVGHSSGGKSASLAVSAELLDVDQRGLTAPVGSGEGMIDAFLVYGKGNTPPVLDPDPRRLFTADEVESLNRLVERSGSTLGGFLKSALMGQELGTTNAKAGGRSRLVPGGDYRLVLVTGVQPRMSGVLLAGETSGLPQRFLWLDDSDPDRPTARNAVAWPGKLDWRPPLVEFGLGDRVLDYPEDIKDEVWAAHIAQQDDREQGQTMEGHLTLTRLKTAFALAMLHGEDRITHQWWGLAGELTAASVRVIQRCRRAVAEEAEEQNISRARAAGRASIATNEVLDEDAAAVQSAIQRLGEVLQQAGDEGALWSDCKQSLGRRQRQVAERALTRLELEGRVEVEETNSGGRGRTGKLVRWSAQN